MSRETWWADHNNLALVAEHMMDNGDSAETIVYMLTKPWKYEDEYRKALIAANS